MGLGKTVQLLAVEAVRRAASSDAGPTLLLCPMSLVGNWQREAARFTPELRVYAHHGRERSSGDDLRERLAETDLVITTYATAARDIDEVSGYESRCRSNTSVRLLCQCASRSGSPPDWARARRSRRAASA